MAKKSPNSKDPLFIVGLGASAGGLDSFEKFFTHLPSSSGIAFVVISHLDPTHKSILTNLIAKFTKMPVHEATDNTQVLANNVYVIPPNKDMSIFHGVLQLFVPQAARGQRHPIDFFFRSLAQDQGDQAICVVLSGTGSEGALGLKAIKEKAGLAMAEDPKTAKYDGMPSNAVATDLVDYVLPADQLAQQLLTYTKRFPIDTGKVGPKTPTDKLNALQKVYAMVRARTGYDFSGYKPATVLRRIQRRMAILQIDNQKDYVTYLSSHPEEIDALFKELLIRVTNFFRDTEAFDALKKTALPAIFKNREREYPVRAWVPACATGEEAYSLAITIREYMDEIQERYRLQIFATDIDSEAIDIARRGVYPDHITEDISKERLERFFTKTAGVYKINEEIRESVIFATQDLVKDPPFSQIDLISCRNVLIYFKAELQHKLFPAFFYALRPRGFLFLGSAETVGTAVDLFSNVDKKWKVYKKKSPEPSPIHGEHKVLKIKKTAPIRVETAEEKSPEITLAELTDKMLLDRYSPAAVLANDNGDILYFHGKTGKYLEPPTGKARMNINDMAREGLAVVLKSALRDATIKKGDVTYDGIKVQTNGSIQTVNLTVQYIQKPEHLKGLLLVVFRDMTAQPLKTSGAAGKIHTQHIKELETDLNATRERLQHTIEELEATNEELKSANEELQSSNEELQSTNEEMETSKEELQAVNEELMLVNSEMQHKVDDLYQVNSDVNNLLASTEIATIFLDKKLNVRKFTPLASGLVSLIQTDVGRPFSDITIKLDYPELANEVKDVLENLVPKENQVRDKKGVWYSVRITPYKTVHGEIDGVVITFVDIDILRKTKTSLEDALTFANSVIDTVVDPLVVLDSSLHIVSTNPSFLREFVLTDGEANSALIYEVNAGAFDIQSLRELLESVLPKQKNLEGYEIDYRFNHGHKKFLVNGTRILQKGKKAELILLSMKPAT